MSYAGPASRASRAPASAPFESPNDRPAASRRPRNTARPPARRQPSYDTEASATRAVMLAGLAIGLAVGAAATLLLAPQSGEDTRRAVARSGRRLRRKGGDAWLDLRDELTRLQRKSRNRREASSL